MQRQLIIAASILGLFGTMTNILFISPLPSLVAALLFPFILINRRYLPKTVFWLLLFFLFAGISTLLYHPASFTQFGFYRYDGNFFISYLPLLVLPFLSLKFNINKLFRYFLYLSTGVNLIVYSINVLQRKDAFSGLFLSTNGAGGYYSIVTSLAFIYFLEKKSYKNLIILFLNIVFLYATYSRGSILGLVVGLSCLFLIYFRKSYLIACLLVALSAIQIYILIDTYPVYKKHIMNSRDANIYRNYEIFVQQHYGFVSTKYNNVLVRMYETWPRAVDCFFHSPLVGTGFGSLNDVPFVFNDPIPGVFSTNKQKEKVYNDSHAHHSFLHFLGEQGIIGLVLFILFWYSVYKFLLRNGQEPTVRDFLLVSFFNLTVMSFTEHRITAPSNALPFVLALSLYYVFVNYQKKQVNITPNTV
ncbi:O-antigen ligase family protein [Adhaeribacter aerolatus]|uniref:O-antigen ligase family protein n=1 Tax=Adhaeribacter aerolatus TaxID=670289 RepID=UPI0011BE904E|nr:O-antigen ligase family protein [Adhaeribacter aerolatus]